MDSIDPSTPPPVAHQPATPVSSSLRTNITGSDKLWAILSHISCLFSIWFIIPIIVYLVMRGESDYAAENAREALNFHISLAIYALCSLPLMFLLIGIPLLVVLGIAALVLSIVAAIKASDGMVYRYPMTIRLVK